MALQRLDKLIALNCNISRKDARKIIKQGAVTKNGTMVLLAQELIDVEADDIQVEGYDFEIKEHIYIMLNKPAGVISATADPRKKTVIDIIPPELSRRSLFPCGRLDKDTTGLLLITDDGEFCHKIMSPSHYVYKTYIAKLKEKLTPESIKFLEEGIELADGTKCLPAKIKYFYENAEHFAEIKIREGKYHQVKRMIAAANNYVKQLSRVQIGALKLDDNLLQGEARELTSEELELVFIDDDEI